MSIQKLQSLALAFTLAVGSSQAGAQTQTLAQAHAEFLNRPEFTEEIRQALRGCASDIQAALARSNLPKAQPLAILPVTRDNNAYIIGLLKSAATAAGLTCVEGKEDPVVVELFNELTWDERKSDWQNPKTTTGIFDPQTLDRFGQLMGAQMLMYAYLREVSGGSGKGYAELEVHVTAIPTKQHLWGQVFARRFYSAPNVTGLVDLDPNMRQVIQESFERGSTALKASAKLKNTRTVAIVPLAGDLDRFISGLAESMVSKTQLLPKQLDIATLGEARALLRDNPAAADALLYGAVRDLSRKLVNQYPDREEYETSSAVQLTIQDSKTGNILWSDLIEARGKDTKTFSWWEMTQRYSPFVLARKWYVLVPLIALAAGFLLLVSFWMLRRAR